MGVEFFVIVEGVATATRNGMQLAVLRPGNFFGELALLDGGPRTATVVADTDMHLLVFSRRDFSRLHSLAPTVAYKMLAELGARLRRADSMFDGKSSSDLTSIRIDLTDAAQIQRSRSPRGHRPSSSTSAGPPKHSRVRNPRSGASWYNGTGRMIPPFPANHGLTPPPYPRRR